MSCAPFVGTPIEVARKMLEIVEVQPGDIVYDLGSGDGRILIMAARDFGARAVGIELRDDLVEKSTGDVKRSMMDKSIKIIRGNFFDVSIDEADVVTLYLTSSANEKLRPKLEHELQQGARVVSHDFRISEWKPSTVYGDLPGHTIYAYRIGNHR